MAPAALAWFAWSEIRERRREKDEIAEAEALAAKGKTFGASAGGEGDGDGDGALTPSAPASQAQAGSLIDSRAGSVMGRDHEELRRSVREAFSGGSGAQ